MHTYVCGCVCVWVDYIGYIANSPVSVCRGCNMCLNMFSGELDNCYLQLSGYTKLTACLSSPKCHPDSICASVQKCVSCLLLSHFGRELEIRKADQGALGHKLNLLEFYPLPFCHCDLGQFPVVTVSLDG